MTNPLRTHLWYVSISCVGLVQICVAQSQCTIVTRCDKDVIASIPRPSTNNPAEQATRSRLALNGITFNNPFACPINTRFCDVIGYCTSVSRLTEATITGLIRFAKEYGGVKLNRWVGMRTF
jgi:hypothetical protein